ncbi:mannan endo-1,4-beta-mannosidase [Raphidocelis subcapitata]|uniref:mannan endo-1,4-beta-mannosidase n=1 Tax=Raphidocelis subcapitata TaxID=307507 RepID=A0A2V0NKK4_9CHLO|nr:mannan endo-1,4-beta-mannosidase [Raphidocelis subcapitata]|eukprot:GBF87864.1 mannan endo-1,4-beta-mannosidase [Raphidocelis subcapitata]
MTDVENAAAGAPAKPAKTKSPPSPLIPKALAALAILTLIAIPVVVPVVVMKTTGKTGRRWATLAEAIEAPPEIVAVPNEEVSKEEIKESFLKVKDNTFERFCRPYYTAGFNAYELVEAAMVSKRAETVGDRSGADIVDATMREAAASGINTIRMWAHTTTSLYPFQTAPGVYDERGLKALDYVLETARKYGLQVILSLVDNWKYYNGVDQYMDWSKTAPKRTMKPPFQDMSGDPAPGDYGTGPQGELVKKYEVERHALFFKDADAKAIYKNNAKFLINRVNTINGRTYRDDPTIIAWNLINEPRCETWLTPQNDDCPKRMQAWLEEMAAFVRAQDTNHMITVGSEGFFGSSTPELVSNNPGQWGIEMGQDFVNNTNIKEIDFATVHAWPDNWQIPQEKVAAFLDKWVQTHIAAASKNLKVSKPVMFEEFGKKLDNKEQTADGIRQLRDPIYASTYDSIEKAITANQPIAGSLFWKWAIPVFNRQDPRGPYGVLPTDTTMAYIREHAQFMKRKLNSVPPRPTCGLGAWFGAFNTDTQERSCVNRPKAAEAFFAISNGTTLAAGAFAEEDLKLAQALRAKSTLVFPTSAACCKPGTGAHEEGCSKTK